jgi:hypothetical protein
VALSPLLESLLRAKNPAAADLLAADSGGAFPKVSGISESSAWPKTSPAMNILVLRSRKKSSKFHKN